MRAFFILRAFFFLSCGNLELLGFVVVFDVDANGEVSGVRCGDGDAGPWWTINIADGPQCLDFLFEPRAVVVPMSTMSGVAMEVQDSLFSSVLEGVFATTDVAQAFDGAQVTTYR